MILIYQFYTFIAKIIILKSIVRFSLNWSNRKLAFLKKCYLVVIWIKSHYEGARNVEIAQNVVEGHNKKEKIGNMYGVTIFNPLGGKRDFHMGESFF